MLQNIKILKKNSLVSILLSILGLSSISKVVKAETYPVCQMPQGDEYILLVVSKTPESQARVKSILPANPNTIICNYLEDTVTRLGGFKTEEDANNLAGYIKDKAGLKTLVVRPPVVIAPQNTTGFNPQPLGKGYAVLVDYFNQPEVASQVRQMLGKEVGLVSYRQRPYLLAIHTSNQNDASTTLKQLSDRGFWVMIVDSDKVTLLSSTVK